MMITGPIAIPTTIYTAENSPPLSDGGGHHIMVYPHEKHDFLDLPTNDPGGKLQKATLTLK